MKIFLNRETALGLVQHTIRSCVDVMFFYCTCIRFYCACFNCAWLRVQVDGVAVCYVPSDMVNPEKIRVSFQAVIIVSLI